MIFVDTNVFAYAVGRPHPLQVEARQFFLDNHSPPPGDRRPLPGRLRRPEPPISPFGTATEPSGTGTESFKVTPASPASNSGVAPPAIQLTALELANTEQ